MIALPRGWSWKHTAEGSILRPPGGLAAGAIRYAERVRPVRRVIDLVDCELARAPRFEVSERLTPEMLITDEGEYAAHLTIRGKAGATPVQRDFGFVIVDGFYSRIIGTARGAESFALFRDTVRGLLRANALMLHNRPRHYWYQPPCGWQPRTRGLQTDWYPPDFPADCRVLSVWPTTPRSRGGSVEQFVDHLVAQDAAELWKLVSGPELSTVASRSGLGGIAVSLSGSFPNRPTSHRQLVVLEDHAYLYPLRLEVLGERRAERDRALVSAVIESTRPIPAVDRPDVGAALDHWIE